MVKEIDSLNTNPEEFAQTPPRDLHPTSDIRFVMVNIGDLSSKVDALIKSVDGHGDKIDDLRHKVSFVKGAIWVMGAVLGLMVVIATWYFTGKLSIVVS